ncbi:MAG: hypothetical protein R3F60_27785 [bacterium]
MRSAPILLAPGLLALGLLAGPARAHDFEALRLEVDASATRVAGTLLVPAAQAEGRAPRVLVEGCAGASTPRLEARALRVVFDLACAAPPTTLRVDDLPPGAPVLVSLRQGARPPSPCWTRGRPSCPSPPRRVAALRAHRRGAHPGGGRPPALRADVRAAGGPAAAPGGALRASPSGTR